MSFTDYLENEILDHIFGATAWTAPATVHVGLCTSITDAGVPTGEPSGNNYARVAYTNNATNFPAASGGSKSNGTLIQFGEASGAWGTPAIWFIADNATPGAGNILFYGDISNPQAIVSGNQPKINISGMTITLD